MAADGLQAIGYLNGDYNLAAKLARGNTSFTLMGGYLRKRSGNHSLKHEDILFPTARVTRDYTTYDGLTDNNQQYAQINVENRTNRHNIVVKGTFVRSQSPGDYNEGTLAYNGLTASSVQTWDNTAQKSLSPTLGFFGSFKIKDNQSLEVTATGSYSGTDYVYQYRENGNTTSTQSNEDRYTTYFSSYYNLKLKNNDPLSVMLFNFNRFYPPRRKEAITCSSTTGTVMRSAVQSSNCSIASGNALRARRPWLLLSKNGMERTAWIKSKNR